ncbi:hypothetical protein AB4403_04470 [Vibrio breoganii]
MNNSILNDAYFTAEEQVCIMDLITHCGHRVELRQTLLNIHNFTIDLNPELGSLLRYVDPYQLDGLFLIMRRFSQGVGLDEMFTPQYLQELWSKK